MSIMDNDRPASPPAGTETVYRQPASKAMQRLSATHGQLRRVVCAAILYCNESPNLPPRLIVGARHGDEVMRNQKADLFEYYDHGHGHPVEGFIDQWGVFMDRKQALEVARAQNQILKKHPRFDELYSEDLY